MPDQTTPSSDSVVNDTETQASTVQTSETATQSPSPAQYPAKSGGKGLGILAVLLSLLALGASGFNVYTSQFAKQANQGAILSGVSSIGGDVKVLAERVGQLQRTQQRAEQTVVTQEQLQTRLLEVNNQTDLAMRDVKDAQVSLQETLAKLSASAERGADKFALDEVSQLLKLANNSAIFSNNRESAIHALRLADSQLKQLADPRYAVVRRAINEEINELDAIKSVDVTSLTAQLDALAKRVPELPLENEPPVTGQVAIAEADSSSEITFGSELEKLWVKTLNVIEIKRIDQPPKPLLEPEQRYFLDQNIQLKLNTAELAVMQSRPDIYQRNVEAAQQWLSEYYDPNDEAVIKMLADLSALKEQTFGAELPSISGSYDALQRIKGGN